MAFIFTMHGGEKHRRGQSGNSSTLPAISEDGDTLSFPVPPVPATKKTSGISPLRHSPHSASAFSDTSSTAAATRDDEKPLTGLKNHKEIAKRGGWKRLVLIAVIVALCLVGLIVGLVVGLRNRNNNDPGWSQTTNSALNTTFPAGSWSIATFLSAATTSCTSNSATWRCYPYVTYNQSTTGSLAQFDWVVYAFTSTSSSSPTYTISSTKNPFALAFNNVTLSILDTGRPTERFIFSVPMSKPVIPATALTSSNVASTCYFNQTILEAELYTKMTATYNSSATGAFTSYPYAVSVSQTAASGSGVPDCLSNVDGSSLGTFSVATAGQECSCDYKNYGN